jgi:cell wall-associated NlpC family hydrolase
MKEFLVIGATLISLVTSGTSAITSNNQMPETRNLRGDHVSVAMIHKAELKAEAQVEFLEKQRIQENSDKVSKAIKQLEKYVGKTWYVFSGNTPSGWDCSGLTMWFYEQIDIKLEHRASKQEKSGKITELPKPGDLVVFKYNGRTDAYHVGIYISDDKMIHAPKHGHTTRKESISNFAGNYSAVTYVSMLDH